jgi:hypothetical protein
MALEPGETDRASANLVLPGAVEVVQVYSHFKCTQDTSRRDGWPSKTLFDLRKKNDTDKGESHEQTEF